MAKTLKTSENYTIKAGAGYNAGSGTRTISLDSRYVTITGDLTVEGTSTTLDTTTLNIEDPIIRLAKNNTNTTDVDSGILIERGVDNNVAFYWNEGDGVFKAVTTTSDGTGTSITDTGLANIRVAEPSNSSDAATRNYVDSQLVSGGFSIGFRGDDSSVVSVLSGNSVLIAGDANISTAATEEDTVNVTLHNDLTNITSITSDSSNGNLTLIANGTGDIVVNNVLTFSGTESTPAIDSSVPKLYHKTAAGGGTGIFFVNSDVSATEEGELISKKKATALAIALG
jgi:hypothetical protein